MQHCTFLVYGGNPPDPEEDFGNDELGDGISVDRGASPKQAGTDRRSLPRGIVILT